MKALNKLGVALGGMLEWYDFAIYAYFALAIANAFFPQSLSASVRLMFTYGIFGITYLARPLGAALFGHIADKYGRALTLKLTPMIISSASILIALLPDYSKIGASASILLLCARFIQGLCLGGDFSGSIIYLVESSKKFRFLHGSFGSCIGSCGILLSSLLATCIYKFSNHLAIQGDEWRIAFGLSLVFGVVIYLLRKNLVETEAYTYSCPDRSKKIHGKNNILSILVIALHATTFYYFFVFLPAFIVKTTHATEKAALINNSFFLFIHILFVPLFGWLSDQWDGKKILLTNYSILFIIMYPLIMHINLADDRFTGLLWLASILTAANSGVIPGFIAALFPTQSRCLNFGFCFNVSFSIFGGVTPVFCLWLFKQTGSHSSIALYLLLVAGLSLGALIAAKPGRIT